MKVSRRREDAPAEPFLPCGSRRCSAIPPESGRSLLPAGETMPLDTRDRDPYWAARNRLSSQDLEDLRNQAVQTVNDRITAATRAMTPAAEAIRKTAHESGEAAQRFKADVQDEVDRQIKASGRAAERVLWGEPEAPTSSDPVARWAEGKVGRGGYGLISSARDARGPANNLLSKDFRGRLLDPKCNQFVWDALQAGGAPAGRVDGGRIPVAKDWGNSSSKIAGYTPIAGPPRPGDVVSNGHHVGIFAPLKNGSPGTVSAATPDSPNGGLVGRVVHNTWGFRGDEGPMTIWRKTGPAPRR